MVETDACGYTQKIKNIINQLSDGMFDAELKRDYDKTSHENEEKSPKTVTDTSAKLSDMEEQHNIILRHQVKNGVRK